MFINSAGSFGHEKVDQFINEIKHVCPIEAVRPFFQRSVEPPSYIQLFAHALEWTNLLKVVATVFLSQLAKDAAKDVWANKAKIADILVDVTVRPLRVLASSIAKTIREGVDRNYHFSIGIPYPDDYWGSCLRIDETDEELVAFRIANFIIRVSLVEEFVKQEMDGVNRPLGGFFLEVLDDGSIKITWTAQSDFSTHEHIIH